MDRIGPPVKAAWFLLLLAFGAVASADAPHINGKLDKLGPYPVLRVWGSPEEMGFAQGYLKAKEIVEIISPAAGGDPRALAIMDQAKHQLLSRISIPNDLRRELEAMYKGIVARLGDQATLKPLDRQLSVDDLILYNAIDLLRAFGCSGFTVWGDKAGKWGVITTRNFDFSLRGKLDVDTQMILVRTPKDGGHAVATITLPGHIGAFSGINDEGVCTFMHDGTGGRTMAISHAVTPMALTLTELLEEVDAASAHARAATMLDSGGAYPFSYMVRVVSPVADGTPPSPEWVFRVDPSGVSRNPIGDHTCITTNHYLEPDLKPAAEADSWSLTRYKRLDQRLSSAMDPAAAWAAQRAVASSDENYPTAHTIIVYPERKRIDVAFATWNGRAVPAPESQPTTITFDQLFTKSP
jgi:hypothetical protein